MQSECLLFQKQYFLFLFFGLIVILGLQLGFF